MKGQDVLLLMKLVSLERQEKYLNGGENVGPRLGLWQDWDVTEEEELKQKGIIEFSGIEAYRDSLYTVRSLERTTGVGKTQIADSINRCIDIGLAKRDRKYGVPRTNKKSLLEFVIYGIKYVFPAKMGELTRGIATSFSAPALNEKLFSSGELIAVWPDERAKSKGLKVIPLFHTVPYAVRQDGDLYAMLALVDAIRLGNQREAGVAANILEKMFTE
ncbi:hypothetical protein [Pantoea agglomerans]|uniref:hypothetical protein n=1 Tax=Enterobacter agglomerans TaxID=549 RepID=UPI000DAC2C8F|nr:hypothetical protein [Pantoea agglomerans]RAH33029.1 hypothetical protein DOT37_02000 [Pantoea agglomerans]TGX93275.1 hypothetical protein E5821_01995 [Pantoea agglomerans]